MALPVKNFFGKINGKTIFDFTKNLDYTLTQQERIEELNKRFSNNNFFEELFEQTYDTKRNVDTSKIKLCLSKSDGIYSETNIAKYLEILTNYILYAPDGEKINKKTEYNFYTNEELFRKELKEKSLEDIIEKENEKDCRNEILDFLVRKGQNYKNQIKQKITHSDVCSNNILFEYNNYITLLKTEMLTMKENNVSVHSQKRIGSIIKDVKDDMLLTKDIMNGTIYFKQVLPDSTAIDWNEFDWGNRNHVLQLLSFRPRYSGFDDDLNCLIYDLNILMKKIKFTNIEYDIINFMRRDKSEVEIAEILNVTQQNISKSMNRIYRKIYNTYIINYDEWYYTYIEKGTWKRCSKCGEIKLANERYFHKEPKGKDGLKSVCKKCFINSKK